MKNCPACKRVFADGKKFCDECEGLDGGPVRLHGTVNADGNSGITVGEKTVVSGEIIGNKEENVYQGPAHITNITNVDDTKRMLTCGMCGLKGTVSDGFHACPACKKDACTAHFDANAKLCHACCEVEVRKGENQYGKEAEKIMVEGGAIDPYERTRLDKIGEGIGLTAERIADLEYDIASALPAKTWGQDQQRILDEARRLLVDENDAEEAFARVDHLAKLFPARDEVQEVWLEALAERNPARALEETGQAVVQHRPADLLSPHLARARLLAEQGRYQEGLDLLDDAIAKPGMTASRPSLLACEAELFLRHFRSTGKQHFLADAAARLGEVAGSNDGYVQAVSALLDYERGDLHALHRAASAGTQNLHLRRCLRFSAMCLKVDELVSGLLVLYGDQDPVVAARSLDVDINADHLVRRCVLAWIRRHVTNDPERFNECQDAVRSNHPPALWLMGAHALCGIAIPEDHRAALDWFRRSMERGFALGKATLAQCLENNLGGHHDAAETRRLLGEAAHGIGGWAVIEWASSSACAQERIANPGLAQTLLEPLCERGWPTAEYCLSKCLASTASAYKAEADTLVQRAAAHGHPALATARQTEVHVDEAKPVTGRLIRSRARGPKVWQ